MSPPNQVFINTAAPSAKKVEATRKSKATENAKESRQQSKYFRSDNSIAVRKAYSRFDNDVEPDNITDDGSPECLDERKTTLYNTHVAVTTEQADNTERETHEQNRSDLWIRQRIKRITASPVGRILKMRKTMKRSRKVKEILHIYTKFRGNQATLHG